MGLDHLLARVTQIMMVLTAYPPFACSCLMLMSVIVCYGELTIGARPAVHVRVRLAIVNISIAAKGGGFDSQCRRSIGPGAELVDAVMAWRRTAAVLILYLAVLELSNGKNGTNVMYYSTVKQTCVPCRHAHLYPNAW